MLAAAVAAESDCNFLYVNLTDVAQPHVGAAERTLSAVFSLARSASPCVVFFDEMQAMFGCKGEGESEGEDGEEEGGVGGRGGG